MSWWQVVGVFVGIPTLLFILIWLAVLHLCQARIPDGIAAARQQQDTPDPQLDATNSSEAGGDRTKDEDRDNEDRDDTGQVTHHDAASSVDEPDNPAAPTRSAADHEPTGPVNRSE